MPSWKVLSALALLCPVFTDATTYIWNGGSGNWNIAANWNIGSTWPGEAPVTGTDIASFTMGVGTVNLTANASINSLVFNDNAGGSPTVTYTITDTFPSTLIFVGTNPTLTDTLGTHTIDASTALNLTAGNSLTVSVATAGDTLTFAAPVNDLSGSSSLTLASGLGTLANTSTISLTDNITLNGGTFQNAGTVEAAGILTFAGATVTSNNSATPPFSCNLGANGPILEAATVNINSGTITIDSSACGTIATAGIVATRIEASSNALTINGGTTNATNEAAISATGSGATGSLLSGNGVNITGGSVNLTNSGTISGADDTGSFLYNNSTVAGTAMNFSGGVITATNNGSATAGGGVLIQSGRQGLINNPINVNGTASVTMSNTNGLSTTSAIGASMLGGALTVSGGSLAFDNSGNLLGLPSGGATYGEFFDGITVSGGSLSLLNTGTLGTGSVTGVRVAALNGSTFLQTGGTVSVTNDTPATITSGNGCLLYMASTGTFTGGTFNCTNNGTVNGDNNTVGAVAGSYVLSSSPMIFGGANITLSNTGTISPSTSRAQGVVMSGTTMSAVGPGGTLNLTNSGLIETSTGSTGVYLLSLGAMTLDTGTWTALNTGIVSSGTGVIMGGETTISLVGTSVTLTNDATANVSSTGIGCSFGAGQSMSFPSGSTATLALINHQALTGVGGIGVQGNANTGTTMASGTFNIINTGTVGPSSAIAGAQYIEDGGSFSQTGGTITMSNSGMISSTAVAACGAALKAAFSGGMSLTGGTLNMTNSGPLDSMTSGVIGVFVNTSGPLTLGGTTITMTNTGNISSPLVGTVGCSLEGFGLTMSGGTLTMTNDGAFAGTPNNIGVYLTNTSTGTLTFSGGTVIGINNTSSILNAFGVKIISGPPGVSLAPITVSGASVTLMNTGNFSTTEGIGAYIQGSALTVSSGSLNYINAGNFTSFQSQGVTSIFNNVTISGGSTSLLNTGFLSGSAGSQEGIIMLISTTFTQTGGVYSNANAGTNSTGTGQGVYTDVGTTTTLSGGTLINTNSGILNVGNGGVFGKAVGSDFLGKGALNLSGGTMILSNTGTISASGSGATGSFMFMGSVATPTPGSTVIMTNAGTVENFSGSIGTDFVSSGAIAISAGTWTALNTGAITTGTGVEINGETTISLSGGSVSILNDVTAAVSGTGIGSQFIAGNTLNFPSGAPVLVLQNNQALSSGTGVLGTIPNITATSPAVNMAAGTFNVVNTAALSGTATGAALQVFNGSFNQTGGIFTVSNSGTNSGSGNASYIQAPAIIVSGTGTFNNPNALVAATTVTINAGGLMQSGMATVPGVFEDASFGSTTSVTNSGGTFVSGTLDPTPGQTVINGSFTQTSGAYTVVIGDLNLPSNEGISFLTVNGTAPTGGIVNLNGGTLNVIPATGFFSLTDIPFGLNKVQFIQASNVINGVFTPLKINNSVPQLVGMTYETIAGNQGWLFFTYVPLSITPASTPLPYQPITITTINMLNTFLGRELLRMQDQFITNDEENQNVGDNQKRKKHHQRRRNPYSPSLANLSMPQSPRSSGGSAQTIANPILAADPKLAFMQYPLQTKQERLASEVSSGNNTKPWNVYFGPLGDIGSINNKHSQLGAHYRSAGALAGFDYRFSQVGVGLLVDYENVKAKLHKHAGDFWINQFHATTYTTYVPKSFPQFAINGMVGAGGAWYNIHRNVLSMPGAESTHAKSRGAVVDALIGAEYLFSHCQFATIPSGLEIVPMFNLQYIYQGVGSYKEHGADMYDLKFNKQGFQSLRSTLGTWLQYIWSWKNFSFTPLIDIAWQREYLDRNHKVRTTPIHLPGPKGSITVFGAGRDTLLAGLDLLFEFYDTYGIEASYDFEYNSLYRNNGFYLGFNVSF